MAILLFICTIGVLFAFCWRVSIEQKLIYILLTTGLFLYSGFGISYYEVNNGYAIHYLFFLIVLLLTVRIVINSKKRIVFGKKTYGYKQDIPFTVQLDSSLEKIDNWIIIFTFIYLVTMLFPLVYPTNRLASIFDFSNFTSHGIHAVRAAHNSNKLLKLSDAVCSACQPFFFVFLYRCAIGKWKKKVLGFFCCVVWFVLSFGKNNYLSRYQLIIFMSFFVMYLIICKYKKITIDKKTMVLLMVLVFILIPYLVSFKDIRLGRSAVKLSFSEALLELIEGECYYPTYYDTCINNAGLVNPIEYILWLIFLPIPSALWSGKPVVQVAYSFTSIFSTLTVNDAAYSNLLPSVLGESFLIFGPYFFWIEAIILGLTIGFYFKFFLASKQLSVLTAYMLLMLSTIGRGGSQSYLGVLINGSVVLIIFVYLSKRVVFGKGRYR